jgi:hypothetical protein
MNHFGLEPNANFDSLLGKVRNQVDIDIFMQRGMGDLDVEVEERDPTIPIHDAGFT